jgi:site-specific recombinase XerD
MATRTRNTNMDRPNLTLQEAIDHYLTNSTLEGKSSQTIIWHRKKLTAFVAHLKAATTPVTVGELTLEDGRAFVKFLMERKTKYPEHTLRHVVQEPLAPQTIQGFVRSLRAFAAWLYQEGYTSDHIFKWLKPPKVPQTLIAPLNEDEIRKILATIPQDTAEGLRNYAMVLLFLDTGIRLSELVGLKISDIDFTRGQFKVFGKGAKERLVPLGYTTRHTLIRYMEHARPQPVNTADDRCFLTVSGQAITIDAVEKLVQRLAQRARVFRLHPHLFRHTFAVRYLTNGGDVFTLQKILGHATLEMTRRYVTLASGDVNEKHRLSSPIDHLGLAERKRGRPRAV